MSKKVIDIGEDGRRMEVRLGRKLGLENGGGLFLSPRCSLSAVWLVEHLGHTRQ